MTCLLERRPFWAHGRGFRTLGACGVSFLSQVRRSKAAKQVPHTAIIEVENHLFLFVEGEGAFFHFCEDVRH